MVGAPRMSECNSDAIDKRQILTSGRSVKANGDYDDLDLTENKNKKNTFEGFRASLLRTLLPNTTRKQASRWFLSSNHVPYRTNPSKEKNIENIFFCKSEYTHD